MFWRVDLCTSIQAVVIQYTPQSEITNRLFESTFDNELDNSNRWVLLCDKLPWDEMLKPLYEKMSDQGR